MIAVDSSSLIAYFGGESGKDVDLIELALETQSLVLPPVVLCELLSDATMPATMRHSLLLIPTIPIYDGYWERAGKIRATLISKKKRARLADTLISQSCIDSKIALITRDLDFRQFEMHCELKIA